ncbi:MAG: AMP-binding protein [Clostridia bacterium]|nr:AMP-binding protein [Clostridia bacterium]
MSEYKVNTLKALLSESCKRHKERTAFLLKDKGGAIFSLSYEQFENDVKSLSTALMSICGSKGKNIGIFMENSYEWCCSFMAITSGVGTAVPLDKDLNDQELYNIIDFAETDIIITDEKRSKTLLKSVENLKRKPEIIITDSSAIKDTHYYADLLKKGSELITHNDSNFSLTKTQPEDTAAIFFTSGTTGMTKGVMLTNNNLCSDFIAVSEYIKIYEGDLSMSVLPLHHTYELIAFLMVIYSGASMSFCKGIRTLKEDFEDYKPTVFVTVPLMLEKIDARILSKMEQSGKRNISKLISKMSPVIPKDSKKKIFSDIHAFFGGRLRMIICGAAALKKETAQNFVSYGIPVIIGYGLTECSPIVICNTDTEPTTDTVGRPLPGTEIKLHRPDANGIGEICVRGPMVMKGYYKNTAQTELVIKDGWFHTGDSGYVDRNGNYHIAGRIKNLIVTRGGKNIYPEEIEFYLLRHSPIAECMVYSETADILAAEILPDTDSIKKKLGKEELTYEETHSAVKEAVRSVNRALPSYKRIKKVNLRDEPFSKTSTHKIKRDK